jgi:hypothetical protein
MQFARINRTDPEQITMPVTSVDAASLTTGFPVALVLNTNASMNFNAAVRALSGTAANLPGFLGVADQDIIANAVGRVVVWGYAKSVLLSVTNTSVTINNGDPLVPGAAGFFSLAPTYAASGFKYVIASAQTGQVVYGNMSAAANAIYAVGFVKGGL